MVNGEFNAPDGLVHVSNEGIKVIRFNKKYDLVELEVPPGCAVYGKNIGDPGRGDRIRIVHNDAPDNVLEAAVVGALCLGNGGYIEIFKSGSQCEYCQKSNNGKIAHPDVESEIKYGLAVDASIYM